MVQKSRALQISCLAKKNPKGAIAWCEKNQEQLEFDWRYDVYAGWVHFWAERPEDVPTYESRRKDAFVWLSENSEVNSNAIHNAHFFWRSEAYHELQTWLKEPASSEKMLAVKELVKARDKEFKPISE